MATRTTSLPTAPPAGTKARRTYESLLDATERLLASVGHTGATSTAIAEEAEVSTGTFYTYFADRDEALAATFTRRLATLLERVRDHLDPAVMLDHGVSVVLERALDAVLDEYRLQAATYRAALAQLPASPRIRDVYWHAHHETQEVVATFLRRAQAAGQARRDADPDVLALTLIVVVQGANHPVLLDETEGPARAVRGELLGLLRHLVVEGSEQR